MVCRHTRQKHCGMQTYPAEALWYADVESRSIVSCRHTKQVNYFVQALEEQEAENSKCCGVKVPAEFRESFREMMDLSLLRNPVFLMFAISNFFTSIGFNMPFIFLPDRAKLAGWDQTRLIFTIFVIYIF